MFRPLARERLQKHGPPWTRTAFAHPSRGKRPRHDRRSEERGRGARPAARFAGSSRSTSTPCGAVAARGASGETPAVARRDVVARRPSPPPSVMVVSRRPARCPSGVGAVPIRPPIFEDHLLRASKNVDSSGLTFRPWRHPCRCRRSCRGRLTPSTSSLGFVQRSPLRRLDREGVHSRSASRLPAARSFGPEAASLRTRSVLVVFHHLDGFLLQHGADILQPASDRGVHLVSADRSVPFPEVCSALRSLPSRRSDEPLSRPVGIGHPRRRCRRPGSPSPLPSRGFRFTPSDSLAGSEDSVPGRSGSHLPIRLDRPCHLRALLHTRVRCRPDSCPSARPVAPVGLGVLTILPPRRRSRGS